MKNNCAEFAMPKSRSRGRGSSLLLHGHRSAEPSFLQTALSKEEGSWLSNETGCVRIPALSYHLSFFLCEMDLMGPPLRQIHIRWEVEMR